MKLVGKFANTYFSFLSDSENIDQYGYVTLTQNAHDFNLYQAAIFNGSDMSYYTSLANYDLSSLYLH
jgi:hypothetical protein